MAPNFISTSLGLKAPLWDIFAPSFSRAYSSHSSTHSSLFQLYFACLYFLFNLSCFISMSKRDFIAFQKGHFRSPCSPRWKTGGALAPLCPLSGVPEFTLVSQHNILILIPISRGFRVLRSPACTLSLMIVQSCLLMWWALLKKERF